MIRRASRDRKVLLFFVGAGFSLFIFLFVAVLRSVGMTRIGG